MRGTDSREIWRDEGLVVRVRLTDGGDLEFAGQDLKPPFGEEYEYWITVPSKDLPTIIEALDGRPGDDVLALVARHAASIVRRGERAWMESLGIEPRFHGR